MLNESQIRHIAHQIFKDKYTIEEKIGDGGCSMVFKATSDKAPEKATALKIITHPGVANESLNEIATLERLNQLIEAKKITAINPETKEKQSFFGLVMDFVPGITLIEYLKKNPELHYSTRIAINRQLMDVVFDLHKMRIIHDDISPANFMITPDTGKITLIDFGWSKIIPSTQRFSDGYTGHYWGWRWFTAPENLPYQGIPGHDRFQLTPASDVYALGKTLSYVYGLLDFELFPNQPLSIEIGSTHQTLLDRMLEENPSKRIPLYQARRTFKLGTSTSKELVFSPTPTKENKISLLSSTSIEYLPSSSEDPEEPEDPNPTPTSPNLKNI